MSEIDKALSILNKGGIIIFPTDTAFGIGCRIDNEISIKKLFQIRKRPIIQATPVLVSSLEMARKYVKEIPKDVEDKLINVYWPGALTIILQARVDKVPKLVRGGGETVGIRMPNNKEVLGVIERAGVPILGPSANFHGKNTPYKMEDLDKDLVNLVDYVLKGECSLKSQSTVIDCTVYPWKILRKGAINITI
ncbi:MAG TPA: L-threonylcarbamoyladenylate synthase [Candidatus Sulfotelmatobacter sp.]|nr:L-threonylcarbamoyladenylate synthase [Candidatus Sulfotelmatobacter sp.]